MYITVKIVSCLYFFLFNSNKIIFHIFTCINMQKKLYNKNKIKIKNTCYMVPELLLNIYFLYSVATFFSSLDQKKDILINLEVK